MAVVTALGAAACTATGGGSAGGSPGFASAVTAPATSHRPSATASSRPSGTGSGSPSVPPVEPSARPGSALAAVAGLVVKGRAPATGYARERFGQAWADADRNGCDTRNDVLRRDLSGLVLDPRTNGCVVLRGQLQDPYTGRTLDFRRGPLTSGLIQVDHVVALADAWQKGAQRWPPAQRVALANDPLDLLAVDGPTNQAKGAGDAATWLPPDRTSWCAYVARQVAVKLKYRLWVTSAERDAMVRVLTRCPGQPLPTSAAPTLAPIAPGSAADPWTGSDQAPPVATSTGAPSGTGSLDPRFDSCAQALAAGYGPYLRGTDPEYDWYHDGDGDGTVCE